MAAPVLAGCSSSGWGPLNQTSSAPAAVPPPPPASQTGYAPASYSATGGQAAAPQAYDARASTYPQQTLFAGATDRSTTPDPAGAGYPLQPLIGSQAPAQSMPHPPNSYTPSAQPYTPPPGQAAYAAPPPAAPAATAAAAPPPEPQHISGYPNQSIVDWFRGNSSESQSVPRPPPSYTPSGQPYSPPGQSAAGAQPAATAAAPPPDQPHISGYPNQSIGDIFR